jgi:excinuclease Cho
MLAQSHHVEFRRTAGDIGALLLESRLIKELQPIHNKKLRRVRQMCALRLGNDDGAGMPEVVFARDHDFATTQNLYGLFATGKSVLEKLRTIVDAQRLCPAVSGLEKLLRGRACFARQLSRCLGAVWARKRCRTIKPACALRWKSCGLWYGLMRDRRASWKNPMTGSRPT